MAVREIEGGASRCVALDDRSQIGEARRLASSLAAEAELGESVRSDVGIVATETASNVIRHAGRGMLLVRRLETGGGGVELLCLDAGPGMKDVDACLADGFSTGGTPGGGLGAVGRRAHAFDVYSAVGHGTAVLARFWNRPDDAVRRAARLVGGLALAMPGETASGDAWAASLGPGGTSVLLADGLGHGPMAAEAAAAAVAIFRVHPDARPADLIERLHAELRATRGAAVAVAVTDGPDSRELCYAGVGNLGAVLVDAARTRSLMSHNGTVGVQLHKTQELAYPWPAEAILVMHSDGLMSNWRLDQYPGLLRRDPALVAGVLYRDFSRGRDDVSVVVQRMTEPWVTL